MIFGQNGLNFRIISSKNSGNFECIHPRGQIATKYTYTLMHFDTVAPSHHFKNITLRKTDSKNHQIAPLENDLVKTKNKTI